MAADDQGSDEQGSPEHWAGEENIPGAAERHAHHPSELDAMGLNKRRPVVGGQYGATVRKQLTVYGIFLAIVAVVVIAFLTVVSSVDNRDIPLKDTAPWTEAGAVQTSPRDIDFPRNGPNNTIPENEIGHAAPPPVSDTDTGG